MTTMPQFFVCVLAANSGYYRSHTFTRSVVGGSSGRITYEAVGAGLITVDLAAVIDDINRVAEIRRLQPQYVFTEPIESNRPFLQNRLCLELAEWTDDRGEMISRISRAVNY